MSRNTLYFSCQSLASFLASSSRRRCLHIKAAAPSNASPKGAPTPIPTAIGSLDDDDGGLEHVVRFEAVRVVVDGVVVDVVVRVIEARFLVKVDVGGADETVAVAV